MDLLGRKVIMKEGKAFQLFLAETQATMEKARAVPQLEGLVQKLEGALKLLQQTTLQLTGLVGQKGVEVFLADATLYLELFSIVAVAWQWLNQAVAAQTALNGKPKSTDINFYQGKLVTARYFFAYELPKINGLAQRLTDNDPLTVEMESSFFND